MMTALGGAAVVPALVRRRSTSASVKPATPRAPTRRKLRRDMLSRYSAPVESQKVSMICPLVRQVEFVSSPGGRPGTLREPAFACAATPPLRQKGGPALSPPPPLPAPPPV